MATLKIASIFFEPVFGKRIRAEINFPSVQLELDVCAIFFIAGGFFSKVTSCFQSFLFYSEQKTFLEVPWQRKSSSKSQIGCLPG